MKTKLQVSIGILVIVSSLLSACGPGQPFSPTLTPTPTNTSTPTLTPTSTITPSPTNTVTPTVTPMPTLTPTLTLTPNLVCVTPPAGLISWWPAEGNAYDIRNINEGMLVYGATFAAGMTGQAFSFDGKGYVSAPAHGLPINNHNRTLDLWVKVNSFFDGEAFFAGYGNFGSYDQSYHLGTAGNTLFFSQWGQALFGPALQTNRWYHVAVTNAGNSVTLYLDGEVIASDTLPIETPRDTQFFIGGLPGDSSKRLDGLVDEVDIYNRVLSLTEIQSIYSAGYKGKCRWLMP